MEENDWIDDVLDDEECSLYQIGKIESLLVTSASNIYYENINMRTENAVLDKATEMFKSWIKNAQIDLDKHIT